MSSADLITGFVSFITTMLILSYLVGDNPAFRATVHIFVGVSTGYVVVTVLRLVILDKLLLPLVNGVSNGAVAEVVFFSFPLLAALLLLGKMFPASEWMGRPIVAFLVGVGTAAAVGGAMMGTIFPQIQALTTGEWIGIRLAGNAGNPALNLVAGVVALIGTIATLAYFQFTLIGQNKVSGKRGWLLNSLALLGQIFIVVTLGVIFAGVLAASLTAFVDRVQSVINLVSGIIF